MEPVTPQPKFLRATQVAQIGNIGLSTVWLYVKQGKLKGKKVSPRVTLFNAVDVYEFFGLITKGA